MIELIIYSNSKRLKRDKFLSLESIDVIAKEKLGLIVPKKENIIVISLPER